MRRPSITIPDGLESALERFDDLRFLAFDDRLAEAVRGASVPVYEGG